MANILIVVPAYNEQATIEQTVGKIIEFTKENQDIDYIVIDDGSTDNTPMLLSQMKANFISHPINLGIGEPFKTGIKYGMQNGYNRFINFDADGQHRLSSLQTLLAVEGADYVIGSRFVNRKKPRNIRMLGSSLLSSAIKLKTKRYIGDPTSGLLLVNSYEFARFYLSLASNKPEPSLYPKIVNRFKVVEVQVDMKERQGGISYFNAYRSLYFMLEQLFMIILKG